MEYRCFSGVEAPDIKPAPLPERIIDIHNHLEPSGDPEALISLMDESNIETTLVMGMFECPNEHILAAIRAHPTRFVGGVWADPREGLAAIDLVRKYNDGGCRIVKLFPNVGYYPDDETFRPFFDVVAELGMAVLSHCGWLMLQGGVTAAYYSQPGRFEKLVRTYTETPFIFAHMGGISGFLEAIMLATRAPNVYVDTSPGQGAWVLTAVGQMVATIPAAKILWGADSYNQAEWLPHNAAALTAIGFGDDFEKIFYSNARDLLVKIGALSAGE